MRSLFKVTLLATTMALTLNANLVMAAEAAKASDAAPAAKFKSDEDAAAYSLCASLRRYIDNPLKEQKTWYHLK